MVSEHNLGLACGISANMLSRRQEEENMRRKDKNKTPSFGGRKEERLPKFLSQTLQSIHEDLKEMRREMCIESPRGFEYESNSRFSYDECEHAATHYDAQRSYMPRFAMREMEEGGMTRRETLSDFLQEYESQTQNFRDHITFQEFCKIKVERSRKHDMGIFLLSTFDGSPTCSARAWVEELHTYLQQHQVSEYEAIKVVVMHFGGKAYAWWIFESFSLRNANISSYTNFTNILVERFDGKHSETSLVGPNKPKQTKPLHMMEEPINSNPLQKTIE